MLGSKKTGDHILGEATSIASVQLIRKQKSLDNTTAFDVCLTTLGKHCILGHKPQSWAWDTSVDLQTFLVHNKILLHIFCAIIN